MCKNTSIAAILILVSLSLNADQAAPPPTIDSWLTEQIKNAITTDDRSHQIDPPAALGEATLVDLSSTSDLVSMATQFAGIASKDANGKQVSSGTATAYAIYAAARGQEPMDPKFYQDHSLLRLVSVTLGTESVPSTGSTTSTASNITQRVYQLKFVALPRKLPTPDEVECLMTGKKCENVSGASASSAGHAFVSIKKALVAILVSTSKARTQIAGDYSKFLKGQTTPPADIDGEVARFLTLTANVDGESRMTPTELDFWAPERTRLLQSEFATTLASLASEDKAAIDSTILQGLAPIKDFTLAERALVNRALRSHQLAVSVAEKDPQASKNPKTFVGEIIYDQGLGPRWSGIANLRYERPEGLVAGKDALVASGALRYVLAPSKRVKKGSYLDIAFDTTLRHEPKNYHVQAKWTLPLTAGIQIPVSVTWANHRELIKESDIRGQIGFSFDLSKLAAALEPKANN